MITKVVEMIPQLLENFFRSCGYTPRTPAIRRRA
jgi:hypothetical protein